MNIEAHIRLISFTHTPLEGSAKRMLSGVRIIRYLSRRKLESCGNSNAYSFAKYSIDAGLILPLFSYTNFDIPRTMLPIREHS